MCVVYFAERAAGSALPPSTPSAVRRLAEMTTTTATTNPSAPPRRFVRVNERFERAQAPGFAVRAVLQLHAQRHVSLRTQQRR